MAYQRRRDGGSPLVACGFPLHVRSVGERDRGRPAVSGQRLSPGGCLERRRPGRPRALSDATCHRFDSAMDTTTRDRILGQVRQLGGAARRSELEASPARIRSLVDSGTLISAGRGCVILPGAARELELAARHDGLVSCVSRLRLAGVMTPGDPAVVHLSVPSHRGSSRKPDDGVVRHREDVGRVVSGRRLVTLAAAAARAAQCLPYDQGVAVVDQTLRTVPPDRRRRLLDDVLAHVGRASPLLAEALRTDVDPRARALRETEVRLVLRRAGLAAMPGAVIPGVGEVDLLVEGAMITEIDGYQFHRERPVFRRDRTRDRRSLDLGFASQRFAWEDSTPLAVLAELRRRLATLDLPFSFALDVDEEVRRRVEQVRATAVEPRYRVVGSLLLRGRARDGVVQPT